MSNEFGLNKLKRLTRPSSRKSEERAILLPRVFEHTDCKAITLRRIIALLGSRNDL
jgi:hypothetical protein